MDAQPVDRSRTPPLLQPHHCIQSFGAPIQGAVGCTRDGAAPISASAVGQTERSGLPTAPLGAQSANSGLDACRCVSPALSKGRWISFGAVAARPLKASISGPLSPRPVCGAVL